jgi:hypothetical protein
MFVDTDLLRMGADFSRSAGIVAQRGADQLAQKRFTSGIFGDFESAHGFHNALSAAHQMHVSTMAGHRAELDGLAEKAGVAATVFQTKDESLAENVTAAGSSLPDR